MHPEDLNPECREFLVDASNVSTGEQWVNFKGAPPSVVQELVSKGLLEYRSGSRQGNQPPHSVAVTAEGRRLAKQIRNQADVNEKSN